MNTIRWMVLLGCAATLAGCNAAPTATQDSGRAMPVVDAPDGDFAGQVSERVDAGSYTYMRVERSDGGDEWVVTLGAGADVGRRVEVTSVGVRNDFRSARLGRTFSRLVFGIVSEVEAS